MPNLGPAGRGGARRRTRRRMVAVGSISRRQNESSQQNSNSASQSSSSDIDELEKLAKLKNDGVLTEEEFQAKKKQILGD